MANRKKYLVDTSVVIAMFRRNENAKKALDSLKQEDAFICDISIRSATAYAAGLFNCGLCFIVQNGIANIQQKGF
ncbi:MAG: hypothetical protein LBB79_00385 [Prevotellaceae bacterium]|jgi:uncharacterized protein with PIN domain|nr:hypothetical protein [Prevotellaceae bacterium]